MNSSTGLELNYEKKLFISRDDREFNIDEDSWRLNKNVVVAVKWMSRLAPIVEASLKSVLARSAEEYAAETVKGLNDETRRYFNITEDREFLVDSLISYRSALSRDEEQKLAKIRMLVRNWTDWGYPGISREVMGLLDGWRLRGMEKGKAIKRLDPEEGPLTEIEMSALIDAMLQAYISGQISLSDYALSTILVYTGRRPIQITSLKIKDICSRKAGEVDEYWINFPRAKQRFSKWRTEFNVYPITEDLWNLLSLHARKISEKVADLVGCELTNQIIQELPLFPDFDAIRKCKDASALLAASLGNELHVERDSCNEVMRTLEALLDVNSERTGSRLNLSTRRFRYTLGSNIAREGKGELIIAEALDHSDTQNVGVYVKNLPDVVERIDRAVALQLAPLAQAFQGVLIESEAEAERGGDKSSRVGNAEVNVGNCGSYGFCGAMAPIACYTCRHFQPWVDGPHEIILDELIDKRDQVLRNTQDIKVASSNDRLILAVAQVIRRCNAKKAERLQLEQC
ncbi:site-specific integrase [Spongiibacter marinus]|uniref:site-specific integrase n=1 Tax=Spongiibacter marinus TaxID=354246 RepID=UPI0035670FD6